MDSRKSLILVCFMVAAMVSVPNARGQIISTLIGTVRGIVGCTLNGIAPPPFPGATVQLQCLGQPVTSTVTNSTGGFVIPGFLIQSLSSILNCTVVVVTPLATCNASLPSVSNALSSGLQIVGNTTTTIFSIVDLVPIRFQLNITIS